MHFLTTCEVFKVPWWYKIPDSCVKSFFLKNIIKGPVNFNEDGVSSFDKVLNFNF